MNAIVKCRNIVKAFPIYRGYLREPIGKVLAVDDVSIEIEKGSVLGLVGGSGSGKTTLGKLILGILKPDSGIVELNTARPQVIFQDPHNSLDPKMKVRDIIAEGLMVQGPLARRDTKPWQAGSRVQGRVEEVLDLVRLPETALSKYPHEFSGGEKQRIAIARAVITRPELIICDEPVSSLDVTIQLGILKLLKNIHSRFSISYLFISHDLRVVRFMCNKIAIMKEGRIVEEGALDKIYSAPTHPYTKLLLSSIPRYPIA